VPVILFAIIFVNLIVIMFASATIAIVLTLMVIREVDAFAHFAKCPAAKFAQTKVFPIVDGGTWEWEW